jgi:cyclopropane-fatty-acyl-phospholipid synthase
MLKNKIFNYLQRADQGYLEITTPENKRILIGDNKSELKANIIIKSWDLIDRVILAGDIGFAESYIDGLFTTDNLTDLLSFFAINQKKLADIFHGSFFNSFLGVIKNLFKKNSIKGSKKNISYHYDMSNDFFSIWLDKSMTYSSGIFENLNQDLFTSQQNKYSRIFNNLSSNGDSILEIGCGWGGFLEYGAKKSKKITGLTISDEQAKYAIKRLDKQNLKARILTKDYRQETEKFDNIVSIEMFEAVGKQYWQEFFTKIKSLLNKNGRAIIQTITIDNQLFKKYCSSTDFIRKHIFPGGFLPSEHAFENLAAKNGFSIVNKFDFADSYYQTLELWSKNFNNSLDEVKKLGFDDYFIRKWRFYLSYCAAGFYGKRTNVVQYCLTNN